MGDASKFFELLKTMAEQLPSLVMMLACIVFAWTRRKRNPRVSLVVIIGLSLLILHAFVMNLVYTWVPGWFLRPDNYDAVRSRNFYLVLGLILNTLAALFTSVLLAAVFMQRKPDLSAKERVEP